MWINLLHQLKKKQRWLENHHQRHVPLLFKISPDLTSEQLKVITILFLEHRLEGLIATNTTNSRQGVEGLMHANEDGGLYDQRIRSPLPFRHGKLDKHLTDLSSMEKLRRCVDVISDHYSIIAPPKH